jgi:hypothetical protein
MISEGTRSSSDGEKSKEHGWRTFQGLLTAEKDRCPPYPWRLLLLPLMSTSLFTATLLPPLFALLLLLLFWVVSPLLFLPY